jgi:hypothetical protein
MSIGSVPKAIFSRLATFFGWNRASYTLMSLFCSIISLVVIVWWPLVRDYFVQIDPAYPAWKQLDWLLLGIFAFMSLLIMSGADLRKDARVVLVGLAGGLLIESWGTQTSLWTYYTNERPPLWIIPAWPIASLAIDRMVRELSRLFPPRTDARYRMLYWAIFPAFLLLMFVFVRPTLDKSLTWMALLACILLTATPTDHRLAVLTFLAGAGLGYFLERWGTTRACWTYYTLQTPPLFAVLAHGLAAVAFWRARLALEASTLRIRPILLGRWVHKKDKKFTAEPQGTQSMERSQFFLLRSTDYYCSSGHD